MKLVYCSQPPLKYIGLYHEGKILNLTQAAQWEGHVFPDKMEDFLHHLDKFEKIARLIDKKFKQGSYVESAKDYDTVSLLAPVMRPTSCRDAYAFRQHVQTARRNRGLDMIPEFDQYPVFYFTNHLAITGPGPITVMEDHLQQLDFELEAAVIIGRKGKNIDAKHADEFIFGYTIMNDWSARVLQMEEMKLSLGPAKGKDFATSLGPMLVTRDELMKYQVPTKSGHIGEQFKLEMKARINGKQVSFGYLSDMDWTFAEIIERVSYGVPIYPTDVIGSGTVGTGCLLEINGTAKLQNPDYQPYWLKERDVVELEITELGTLSNTILKDSNPHSILAKKHNVQ